MAPTDESGGRNSQFRIRGPRFRDVLAMILIIIAASALELKRRVRSLLD